MPVREEAVAVSNKGLDFHQYWTIVRKRWWLILATGALVAAFMGAYTVRQPRIYMAVASVVIDPQAPRVLDPSQPEVLQLGTGNYWTNTEYYNTQYKILRSRSLSEEVVRRYDLTKDPRLTGPVAGRSDEELVTRAAQALQGRIRVMPVKDSRIVGIGIRDRDPKLAAELANALANVYIEQNLALKLDTTRGAKRFLAKELDEAQKELEQAEKTLYAFRKDNNLLSVAIEDQQNMTAAALRDFNTSLTDTQKRRFELEERRKAVAALIGSDNNLDGPAALGDQGSSLEQLRRAYLEEKRKLEVSEERYGPKHPEYVNQVARVQTARRDLDSEAQTVLKSMDEEIGALLRTEKKHQAEMERLTQQALSLNQKEIEYRSLKRASDNSQTVYEGLLKRVNESGLQEQDQSNNIRLLDSAMVPSVSIEPNIKNIAALSIVLMLLVSLGSAFFVEFLDRSVKTQEDLEAAAQAPFLGFLPTVAADGRAGKELFVLNHPKSTAAECCRVVRTNILFCSPDKPLRSICVTSSNPVEGKTMNVVNLGIAMAQGGHRTLLVDTDMRRPRLHKVLGISNEHGVSRLTVEEGPIEEAVKSTDVPNLYLLPCGPIPPNPAELIQTEKFQTLVKRLLEKFDRVIFDSPPVLAVTDAAVLSRVVDGTVLVVRAGSTSRDAVVRARQRLQAVNAPIIGAVLNDVNLRNPHYASYYYQYQYKYHDPSPAPAKAAAGGSKVED